MVREVLSVVLLISACGDDGPAARTDAGSEPADAGAPDGGPVGWPAAEAPASTVSADGVRRDLFRVDGFAPQPNPVTGEATPPALDATQVLRYRVDADPPAPARAVLVAMPGFLGGGGSFDALARALVVRGRDDGAPVEVWAIDRRANLLEDLRGMDAAEVAGDAEIAQGYYFRDDTVGGEAFEGFLPQGRLAFMSEWGLETHVEDLRRVIALIPEPLRRGHVFLLGHSLGASFTEVYASWRFPDGTRGVEELAGLILVDGALSGEPIDEAAYVGGTRGGIASQPGIDAIREGTRYVALPLLGLEVYARAEIMSLRVLNDPDAVVVDRGRDRIFQLLLDLSPGEVPAMTNRAALGFGFDDQTNALSFAQVSLGHATGGSVETYTSALGGGELLHPTDPEATYDWIDAFDADPPEHTPLASLAHSFVDGRSNFAEWYFPTRLPLDISAARGTDVPEGDWRQEAGIRAFDRELVDAPVLAIAAALVGAHGYDDLATRLAPAVGEGRRRAGATRAEELGLRVVDATHLSHIDPLTGADVATNPVPAEVHRFVMEHVAESGTVSLPAM